MKCLIIAAGKGGRLQQMGNSKPLIPILGIPLIERVIRAAMEAGAEDFYVVIGYEGERVRLFLERLEERLAIGITSLLNDDWDKENGLSVLKARDVLHEPFLLLMADHLFDPNPGDVAPVRLFFPFSTTEEWLQAALRPRFLEQ